MTSKKLFSKSFADIFSVVVVGNKSVGKTTLIRKLIETKEIRDSDNSYRKSINPNIFYEKCFEYDSNEYLFKIWDTPSNLNEIKRQYTRLLKKADCIIILCAANDKSSFNTLNDWVSMINNLTSFTSNTSVTSNNSICHKTNSNVYIINNKIDLVEDRVIGLDELNQISEQIKIKCFEVSAINGDSMNASFNTIFQNIINRIYKNNCQEPIENMNIKTNTNKHSTCSNCFCTIY